MTGSRWTIANDDLRPPMDDGTAAPDHVQPFMLDTSGLRGRIVRLPTVAHDIVTAHHYPEPIARLLAEALCLTTLLAGMLKYDGVFTLQAKGNGIIRTLVCDLTNDGKIRAYAGYDEDALKNASDTGFRALIQGGYLAFTVDQAHQDDRYQGIVPLEGANLTECVRHYFEQSEQIKTGFVTHVAQNDAGQWCGGAIMLQQLAREGGHNAPEHQGEHEQDAWRTAMTLMQTLRADELLDSGVGLNAILYRLFHEDGVRVFAPVTIARGCRCNADKIQSVLDGLSDAEKADIAENGVIMVTCEFCNTSYSFPV